MNTCDTCKWWRQFTNYPGSYCSNPKLGEQVECEDCLSYPYHEGVNFEPGPKFGCIHHSKNNENV